VGVLPLHLRERYRRHKPRYISRQQDHRNSQPQQPVAKEATARRQIDFHTAILFLSMGMRYAHLRAEDLVRRLE
jgi:hypothetical protein